MGAVVARASPLWSTMHVPSNACICTYASRPPSRSHREPQHPDEPRRSVRRARLLRRARPAACVSSTASAAVVACLPRLLLVSPATTASAAALVERGAQPRETPSSTHGPYMRVHARACTRMYGPCVLEGVSRGCAPRSTRAAALAVVAGLTRSRRGKQATTAAEAVELTQAAGRARRRRRARRTERRGSSGCCGSRCERLGGRLAYVHMHALEGTCIVDQSGLARATTAPKCTQVEHTYCSASGLA